MTNRVFISYSHKDDKWLAEFQIHLKPYARNNSISSWSDEQITPGSIWFDEIKSALADTSVAVLLVTPNFLNSDFIYEHELGPLLKEAKLGGVKILWVPVRASSYEETALKDYQALLHPSTPLAKMTEPDRDTAWVKICDEIEKQLTAAAQKEVAYARLLEEAAEAEAGLAADHFKMAWNTAFRECRHGQTGFRGGQQADETVATTHNTVVDLRSL